MNRHFPAALLSFIHKRECFALIMPFLAFVSCSSQTSLLTGEYLVVSPCVGDEARRFEPLSMTFDSVVWLRNSDENATLELRRGWRDPTISDELILQFLDLPAIRASFDLSPDSEISFDKLARVTLLLGDTCPASLQPLVALSGTMTLEKFNLAPGGLIVGSVRFDLIDQRADQTAEPVGRNLVLTFAKDLTEKDPLTGYGR
jgi:hypothetical protein